VAVILITSQMKDSGVTLSREVSVGARGWAELMAQRRRDPAYWPTLLREDGTLCYLFWGGKWRALPLRAA